MSFKAKTPTIYKDKLNIDCYNFIQQFKDYFAMSDTSDNN